MSYNTLPIFLMFELYIIPSKTIVMGSSSLLTRYLDALVIYQVSPLNGTFQAKFRKF